MLDSIVTSKARVKLLLKFFINPEVSAYLRELSTEFGGSTNSVRVELNRLVDAKLLNVEKKGRNIFYSANVEHPLFPEIHSISRKMTGLDKIYDFVFKMGSLEAAYIVGDYAQGIDSGVVDLILVGMLDREQINRVIYSIEKLISRRIRPLHVTKEEFKKIKGRFQKGKILLLWGSGNGDDINDFNGVVRN